MPIKLHDLRPAPGAKTPKRRVGRGEGGKGGKTAGRGTKGTGARKNVPAGFEGGQMPLHMRLPKLKGFRNRFRVEFQVVNVGDLARLFPEGGTVGPEELASAGAVRPKKLVKVLGHRAVATLVRGADRRPPRASVRAVGRPAAVRVAPYPGAAQSGEFRGSTGGSPCSALSGRP